MIEQLEHSLILGRELLENELIDLGILNFVAKPVIKAFYDYWVKHDVKSNTLKQIQVTLESGKELILNGNSEALYNRLLEENFPLFLEADQTTHQCNRNHKNFERLLEITKDTFANYLSKVREFLKVEEDVLDYGELCRLAFKTKDQAKETLIKQLEYTEKSIQIIEEDPSILSLSVGRRIIVKALRKGFEATKKEFFQSINETYE